MELIVFWLAVVLTAILLTVVGALLISMTGKGKHLGNADLYSIKDLCRAREHHCWSCPLHIGKGCALAGPPCDWEEAHLHWRWPRE